MNADIENDLAGRLIAGEAGAFRDFVETYKKKAYGLAYAMTGNHADAEDVSQTAFLKVFKSVGTLRPDGGLNAWLYRIVYNAAIDHLRKKPFFPPEAAAEAVSGMPGFGEPVDLSTNPQKAAEMSHLRRTIDQALGTISERERSTFILRHFHGLSLNEIAEVLGITVGAAKSYLFRSMHKLQKQLSAARACWTMEADHD